MSLLFCKMASFMYYLDQSFSQGWIGPVATSVAQSILPGMFRECKILRLCTWTPEHAQHEITSSSQKKSPKNKYNKNLKLAHIFTSILTQGCIIQQCISYATLMSKRFCYYSHCCSLPLKPTKNNTIHALSGRGRGGVQREMLPEAECNFTFVWVFFSLSLLSFSFSLLHNGFRVWENDY